VNEGAAKAKDILNLIKIIQETVKRERGIELETEVIVLGE
jgi:UDP-N-acetylmuramate dehydrogenase